MNSRLRMPHVALWLVTLTILGSGRVGAQVDLSGEWAARLLEPVPTRIVDEIAGQPNGYVPHHLLGANEFLKEFAAQAGLPFEATRGGAQTMYPEYQVRLRELAAHTHP